jgi:AraC-like DNA-binding protein
MSVPDHGELAGMSDAPYAGRRTCGTAATGQEALIAESVRRLPAPALRPFIAWYAGYREVGSRPGQHRGLPSPYLTLIFTLDEPLRLAVHVDPRVPASEHDTLLGGLHTAPALVTHPGRQSGVQLALSPLGARALLGLPAGQLAGLDIEAADVLGALAYEVKERMRAAPNWRERFAILDGLLLRHGRWDRTVPPEVVQAWRRVLDTGGILPVSGLAHEVGWSSRHLATRFRAEIGLTPKAAARVVRFDRTRRLLQRSVATGRRPALADAAATCGYFDQAHLAREFGALAGCSPSRWLAEEYGPSGWWAQPEEIRNVQAGPAGTVSASEP